ncbi:AraC family transcriptional regulator [Caballeronia novacaledonica]|uniref:AraC family transcriptional regulator n=1 Tax=Caballeronia novacaledonica TaxID=1544861 RepID=A0ACB5R5N5_9BURK|nr:AraC family transcriptional regulator [Caballeronia novacaledonica]
MPLSPKAQALSALYRNCVFRSDTRSDAHEHVARELSDHVVTWKQGAPDAALYKGELNQLRIYSLRYGAQVEVTPQPFEGFTLVHTSLAGGAEFMCDGRSIHVAEGRTAVLAPKKNCRLRWLAGTQQLIVRVPDSLLRDVTGELQGDIVELNAGLLPRALASQWDLITQSLLNILSMPQEAGLRAAWLEHFERNLALFLLAHRPDATSPIEDRAQSSKNQGNDVHANGIREMDALLAYIDSRLCAPISLEDLARAAGVSVRTLNMLCHRHHGLPPMELLRNLRLDAVRARLLTDASASITETALAFGFGHLGRFSAYYAARFHELPRDTQRRGHT